MDFNEICCNIRSCLNSSKSQLSLNQLNRDYNEVLGENIPFRSVGFASLEALIRAVPNIRISSIRGEIFVDVKPDEKTAHIASLVREQRTSKKKKKKSSRGGFYRGSVAPPRRPAPMPAAPRRSAPPPSYQNDYKRDLPSDYNSGRKRDSPSEQWYQSQRGRNPPRQSDGQNSRRRDPSPPPPTSNNYYSRRRELSSPPKSSYSNHRNSTVIELSSDEENRIEQITRKYRSHPSQYDFSDPNEYDDVGGSDFEDCDEINNKIEELQVTLGKQRQVSMINKPKYRSNPSATSNDDDYGYSSMRTISKSRNEGGNSRGPYYQTASSDSYDHYDEDDYDYTSSSTTTTNTSTTTGRFESSTNTNGYASARSSQGYIRRPFGRANLRPDGYVVEECPRGGSRGRERRPNARSTCSESSMCATVMPERNIKVTVPNGSGRSRVVAFLLR